MFNLPIPVPPVSPTPPTPDSPQRTGLGLSEDSFDLSSLSPYKENFRYGSSSLSNGLTSPASPMSPLYQPMSGEGGGIGLSIQDETGPFNFQPMSLSKSPIVKSVSIAVLQSMEITYNAKECWSKKRS